MTVINFEEVIKKRVDSALDDDGHLFSDHAITDRFSERYKDKLRYVANRAQWYQWDGVRWCPETTLLVFDLARDCCVEDAETYGNGKPPARAYSAKTVAAVHTLARADRRHAGTLDQFDSDPWLLTTINETYDLRTGIGRAPSPGDYITKTAACAAAPAGTPHPLWSAFLHRITAGDAALEGFLRRYYGYSLTGVTAEHCFTFNYGTGANGKGTLLNTVSKILGDYCATADVGTFIASSNDRHPTDVAKLHGARLVIAQETEKGRRWDEAKIKSMTGGDKMTARFMRQDFFDFVPTFKLSITGNHKPTLENVDEAMRRRLHLVPFAVQIPREERDLDLPAKLEAEWPAILRWMIDGCLEWQRVGLRPPQAVTDATADYFADQDVPQQWIDECIERANPLAFTRISELFASWKRYCDGINIKPGGSNNLSEVLTDKGFVKGREVGTQQRGFKGIQLIG